MSSQSARERTGHNKGMSGLAVVLAAVLVFILIGLAGYGICRFAAGKENCAGFYKLLVLPLTSFVSGFVSLMILKKAGPCLIAAALSNIPLFLFVCGLHASVLLWNLIYILSGLIGLIIAYLALTHRTGGEQDSR